MKIPTVKIDRDGTPVVINKDDLKKEDKLWQDVKPKPVVKKVARASK